MNFFGTVLELNTSFKAESLYQRLVADIIKTDKEREVFIDFLHTNMTSGEKVFERLVLDTEADANKEVKNGFSVSNELLVNYVVEELKATRNGNGDIDAILKLRI